LRLYLEERRRIVGGKQEALFLLRPNKPLRYSVALRYFEQIIVAVRTRAAAGRREIRYGIPSPFGACSRGIALERMLVLCCPTSPYIWGI
jgi:hypothetical protein